MARVIGPVTSRTAREAPAWFERTRFEEPVGRQLLRTEHITSRELEVLELVAAGLENREIAARLYLSVETVKTHIRHVFGALGARSRAHAVAIGFRTGLLR